MAGIDSCGVWSPAGGIKGLLTLSQEAWRELTARYAQAYHGESLTEGMRRLPVGELLDRIAHLPVDPPAWGWVEENVARLVDHNASHLQHFWGQLIADPKKAGRGADPPKIAPVFHYAARPAEQQKAREDELAAKRRQRPSIDQLARMT